MFGEGSYKNLAVRCLGALLWLCAGSSFALPISYGTATHETTAWQELATYTGGVKTDDFGTFWSVDGGLTWGREELFVGQTVQFKFNVHKQNVGTHYADFLKAWIDFDQDGVFDEADTVAYTERALTVTESGNIGSWKTPKVPNFSVFSSAILLTKDFVGELMLRARVVCSESLVHSIGGSWDDQWNPVYKSQYETIFSPTGNYRQGEVEEWVLKVSDVPESSAVLLLGLAMFGLRVASKRK